MSEESVEEEDLKNTKFMVFTLLRILKFFYSFKQLENRLNIPSQVLWRYVTLRVTPEKQTADKILARIKETRLVEEVISREVTEDKELWVISSNPGILELAALRLVYELRKSRIDVILSTPDIYSLPLASIISSYFKAKLCIPSHMPLSNNVLSESYQVAPGILDVAAIPRDCIPRKSRVLITTLAATNSLYLNPAFKLAVKRYAHISAVFSVLGNSQVITEVARNYGVEPEPRIVVLVEMDVKNG
ncbi:MAG: hypothetical protein F7B60_00430 [Desulfurococcales archaeon]|nr:hypothetical protein [Desulfurococcales archaeon]